MRVGHAGRTAALALAFFAGGFLSAYMLISASHCRLAALDAIRRQPGRRVARRRDSAHIDSSANAQPPSERSQALSGAKEAEAAQPPTPQPQQSAFQSAARALTACQRAHSGDIVLQPASSSSSSSSAASGADGRPGARALFRATSGIPTDIQLPELVFGPQARGQASQHSQPVLPFSTYAPCRLLDVEPGRSDHGEIFEGIRTIAAYYLRADNASICECIQTFGLNDLLFRIARLEHEFRGGLRTGSKSEVELRSLLAAGDGRAGVVPGPSRVEELELVRSVVAALMHELECILHEYLSFNWNRTDDIYAANRHLLRREGLVCAWKSAADLASLPSTPSFAASPPGRWDTDSTTSGSYNNLQELEAELAATPRLSETAPGSFDEYMARRRQPPQRRAPRQGQAAGSQLSSPTPSVDNLDAEARYREEQQHSSAASGASGQADPATPGASPKSRKHRQDSYKRAVRNWRRAKAAATRKVTEDMVGQQRRFQSLAQMFDDLNRVPELASAAERHPVLLLLGGGMAAGKSTVREIIGRDGFWSKVGKDAVVIEADAIKNSGAIHQSRARLAGLDQEAELLQHLHEYSTSRAEALLVMAVNQQRDIIFDGTMTWAPFVQQTIAMVRDHKHNYRRGPGLDVNEEGTTIERYWEVDDNGDAGVGSKLPYRIELVGVTCDAGLAVARGIWRKIRTGRSVPVQSQLRSHRLFSRNFETFASLVDAATLYHTGSALTTFNKGGVDLSPKVIAHRSSYTRGELLINPSAYQSFVQKVNIVDTASCRRDLYECGQPCDGKVPVTHEDEMSTLRHVFRRADRQERRALRKQPMRRRNSFW